VPALLADMISAQEVAATAETARVTAMLAAETFACEAAAAWVSTTLRVKDVKDMAAMAEREALEWVSRAEAENAMALASTREDAEGFAHKIVLLEDTLTVEHQAREVSKRESREQLKELTLP
jgi:hypothetical protein